MRAQTRAVRARAGPGEPRDPATAPRGSGASWCGIYEKPRRRPRRWPGTLADEMMRTPELALETHAREELGINPGALGSPVQAAVSSFATFALGALLPLIPWFVTAGHRRRRGLGRRRRASPPWRWVPPWPPSPGRAGGARRSASSWSWPRWPPASPTASARADRRERRPLRARGPLGPAGPAVRTTPGRRRRRPGRCGRPSKPNGRYRARPGRWRRRRRACPR